MAFVLQSFAEDTLASDITDSSTSMTLTTGNFGTPSGEQMLVIDPDVSAKREVVKCAIDGTAVTSIDRAQDGTAAVAHTSGAKIIMAWTKSHHEALKDGTDLNDNIITAAKLDANLLAGWWLLAASGTRVGDTSFTVSGDVTDQIAVWDKLKITDTTTKYLYVTAVTYGAPSTTITVTGGTDYVVDGNPTNIYYSKATSPVGFPGWFAYTPTLGGNGSMTYGTTTVNIARFKMDGNMVTLVINHTGTVGGTPNTTISATLPVNCKDDYTYCANNIFNNGANAVGYSGVATSNQSINSRIANGSNWTAGVIIVRANICYESA